MELRYQQLSPINVESAHEILRLCGQDMQERLGLNHWVPPYSLEKLRRDAENRQVCSYQECRASNAERSDP